MLKSIVFIIAFSMLINCSEKPPKVEKIGRNEALIIYYSQSDGEGTYMAAELLYLELIGDPQEWYQAMSKDTVSFNHFLKDLGNFVFSVDISSITKENLESNRLQAIDELRSAKISKEFVNMNLQVVQELESIKLE